jgi:hypothetical protein
MPRSESPRATLPAFTISACLLLAAPLGALGQGTAGLAGVVLDERTLEPIGGATVSAVGVEVETGPDGTFDFGALPSGRITIRIRIPGRPGLVDVAELAPDASTFYRFLVPELAAVLSEILVNASDDGDAASGLTAADLVARRIPGLPPLTNSPAGGTRYAPLKLRGSSSMLSRGEPVVILDGIRLGELNGAMRELSLIPAADVEEITVMMGPAAAFLNLLAAHGAIVVATKRGVDAVEN